MNKTDMALRGFLYPLIFWIWCIAVATLVLGSPAHASVSGYTRTPSGSPVASGSNVEIQFDYEAGDSSGFARTAVALFNNADAMVACEQTDVVSGVGGSVDITFTTPADGEVYNVLWGKISSVAPTYPFCSSVSTITNWNSTKDGGETLETGTPAFVISSEGGGGGTSTPPVSTEEDKTGILIAFLALFAGSFGSAYWLTRVFV